MSDSRASLVYMLRPVPSLTELAQSELSQLWKNAEDTADAMLMNELQAEADRRSALS